MLYKITLKQLTSYIGTIKANSILGAFCSAASSIYNNVDELVNDIAFSDLFEENSLPIGITNNTTIFKTKNSESNILVTRTLIDRQGSYNTINNYNGRFFKDGKCEFFVYTKFLNLEELRNIIEIMLIFGLGKWRRVGNGSFVLEKIEEFQPVFSNDKKDLKFVALSDFLPNNDILSKIDNVGYSIREAISTNGKKQNIYTLFKVGTTFNNFPGYIVGENIYDSKSETFVHGKVIILGVC